MRRQADGAVRLAAATLNPRLVQIVECRCFAGYSESQAAEALGLSERNLQRDWAVARARLKKGLER
jgi:DNA-directed RNA polymerase specialized sigma24 family protein